MSAAMRSINYLLGLKTLQQAPPDKGAQDAFAQSGLVAHAQRAAERYLAG